MCSVNNKQDASQYPPTLTVIIVSWNTIHLLRACLESLAAASLAPQMEVIVVDNASSDGSAAMVEHAFPSVRLLRNSENVGFARANNQAICYSRAPFVLLLNSDTVVPPHALAHLLEFMQQHPEAGACGPRLLQPDGEPQAFAFGGDPTPGYLLRRGLVRLLLRRPLHNWHTTQVQPVDWVSGACLLVRRAAIQQAGLLDEHFFMYFEDNDWCLRIRHCGWQVYYNPQVAITHIGGQSLAQNPAARRAYYHSLNYFYSQHYGTLARLWLRVALAFYRIAMR
jgi:hypothetical protein